MQIGGGDHTYRWIDNWARLPDSSPTSEHRAHHGVVVTEADHVMVFDEGGPAVLAFDTDGALQDRWDSSLTNAHGMTLVKEGGAEFLWMADNIDGRVAKTTIDGRTEMVLDRPDLPIYRHADYKPTWVAVNEERHGGNGDIWVTDGYGEGHIHRYDRSGRYLDSINGEEGGAGRFAQPHGIWIGARSSGRELYISDRANARVQVYDTDGNFKRVIGPDLFNPRSPSGFMALGDLLIVVELRARLTLLDGEDGLVRYIGENPGVAEIDGWPDVPAELVDPGRFNSPHSVASDSRGNLYVTEFITGGRITKLERV